MNAYVALPIVAGLTLTIGIGLPLLRSWLRDGIVALVHPGSELQRFLHNAFSAALLAYGLWTVALAVLGPTALDVHEVPGWAQLAGLLIGSAGLTLVVVAQAQMGRSWRIGIDEAPMALVTHGVFRFSRNPIYLGMLLLAVGVAVVAPSGWTITGLWLVYVLVGFQARAEEEHLLRQHGDVFVQWAARVGRFVPGLGRWSGDAP